MKFSARVLAYDLRLEDESPRQFSAFYLFIYLFSVGTCQSTVEVRRQLVAIGSFL